MRRRAGSSTAANPYERLGFVEGLRGLAALYVVLGHFAGMVDPKGNRGVSEAPHWLAMAMAPLRYGHLAVAAFIVISGFCLQLSLFHGKDGRIHDSKRFFARRAWRILPPYYACLAISIIVGLTVTANQRVEPFTQYLPINGTTILVHMGMIHNLSADWMYTINGVLWSIAIEVQLYILFPLLVASLFRVGRFWLLAFASGLALAVLGFAPTAMKLYPWYLPLFCAGIVAAHFAYKPNLWVGTVPTLAKCLLAIGVAGVLWACATTKSLPIRDAFIGLVVASTVYIGSVRPFGTIGRALGWKPIALLGLFSYSLYLMHHPILQILFIYRPAFVQGQVAEMLYLMVFGLPLILTATFIFSLVFERPFMSAKAGKRQTDKAPRYTPITLPLRVVHASPTLAVVQLEDSRSIAGGLF